MLTVISNNVVLYMSGSIRSFRSYSDFAISEEQGNFAHRQESLKFKIVLFHVSTISMELPVAEVACVCLQSSAPGVRSCVDRLCLFTVQRPRYPGHSRATACLCLAPEGSRPERCLR